MENTNTSTPRMNPDPSPTKPPIRRCSALESLSQWFWSAWTINNSETHGSLVESFDVVDNTYLFAPVIDVGDDEPRRGTRLHEQCQMDVDQDLSCNACRARGVTCDGRRPRCSHCLEQQVLCFYVAPVQHGKATSKSARLAFEDAQPQAQIQNV